MIPEIENRLTWAIVKKIAAAFNMEQPNLKKLGGFESHVISGNIRGTEVVLKITHSIRRSRSQLLAEAHFVDELGRLGCSVVTPILSSAGNLVEAVADGYDGEFFGVLWTKAAGRHVGKDDWTGRLFQIWGSDMAKMHEASLSMESREFTWMANRQLWFQEEQLKVDRYLSFDDPVHSFVKTRMEEMKEVNWGDSQFGLVHSDFHPGNFFLHNHSLHIFDFDDCGHHPFLNDISISAYYALCYPPDGVQQFDDERVKIFLENFFEGYSRVRSLPPFTKWIPTWVQIRHALVYVIFHQSGRALTLDVNGKKQLVAHQEEIVNGFKWFRAMESIL